MAGLAVGALLLAGCDGGGAGAPEGSQSPSEAAEQISGSIDWGARAGEVALPNGWRIAFCEGQAPVLCVRDGEQELGTIDLADHPSGEELSLEGRVADFHEATRRDRTTACPGHEFAALGPEDAVLGGLAAKWYGFTVDDGDGVVTERVVGWMADRGDRVFVFTVDARLPDACPGAVEAPLLTPDQLGEIEPWLDEVAGALALPSAEGESRQARVREWDAANRTVVLDEVAMLSGEEALAAAREDGQLAEGESSLPNDFYIDDLPDTPARMPVAADATARVFDCSAGCELVDVDVDALLRGEARPMNGEGAVFDLVVRDGQVTSFAEVYFP